MYKNKKICCIVPARKNSSELHKKNLKKINNIPLFLHPIFQAKKSKFIDKIYFNSDSKFMVNLSKKIGATANFIRSKKHSTNKSKIADVLMHHFKHYDINNKFDYFILLEPTSPLTSVKDIDKAIKILINHKQATSLVSVSSKLTQNFKIELKKNNRLLKPIKSTSLYKMRRQDLNREYFVCGTLYISEVKSFIKYKNFVQKNTTYYEVDKIKAFEIDDFIDFQIVKQLYKFRKKFEKN